MTVCIVVVFPAVIVGAPCASRKPSALATTVYVPAKAERLKVPSGLTATDVARVVSGLYKLTVTDLLARTCPARLPCGVVTVRLVGVEGIVVKASLPSETRTVH